MSRLLLLCLLASTHAFGKGLPPSFSCAPHAPLLSTVFVDTIPPTIQCPPSDTVTLGVGECAAIYNYTVTANDDQPIYILIQLGGLASGSEFPLGTTINTFLVTDLAGNTATCSFFVKMVEASITLTCDDLVEVSLGANCMAKVLSENVLLPPYGCTDNDVVEIDKVPPYGNGPWVLAAVGQADVGKTYGYRVKDGASGNICLGNIHITDPAPSIICQDVTVHCAVDNLEPAFMVDSLGIPAGLPIIIENCPGFSLKHIDTLLNLPCDPLSDISGKVTRTWTVTDASGNTATCQQTIFRQRSFTGIQFPLNDTLSCAEANNIALSGAPVVKVGNAKFPLWPAAYCDLEAKYFDTLLTPFCGGGGRFVRTWKVFDLCQFDSLVGLQIIDFVDGTGPVLSCDSIFTVSVAATDCKGEVDLPDVRIKDDCSPVESVKAYWTADGMADSLAGTLTSPDTLGMLGIAVGFPVGNTVVRYVATDACGNTSSCETTVTVWDTEPPLAGCVSFVTVTLDDHGQFWLGADSLDLGSIDSCSQALSFKMRRTLDNECQTNSMLYDAVLFCCTDLGDTIELTRRVYDVAVPAGPVTPGYAAGHFSECTVKVQVLDTLAASCFAPPDVALDCGDFDPLLSDYGSPTFNCAVDSHAVTVNYAEFDSSCRRGTIVRTFRVFDKNGNSGECAQQITVHHIQDYYIKFPDDKIVTMCDGTNLYGEPTFLSNGCEDLEATFEDEIFNVVPDACFKIERTWTIRNKCTYDSTLASVVVPNPNPNPVSNHSSNLPGPVVSRAGALNPWAPTSVKIAPTDSLPTDFSTFWDSSANAYTYKQVIKFIDTQKPVISNCPADTVMFGDSTSNNTFLWNQPYWLDTVANSHDLTDGPAPLAVTASDACSGSDVHISFLLFLDLDGDGAQETVVRSDSSPAPGTVQFGNALNPNYSGGESRIFDDRPVSANAIYRWVLHQSVSGNQRTASIQWKTLLQLPTPASPFGAPGIAPQLPYGTHRVRWTVKDLCGNESVCEYSFEVKDVAPPDVNCLNKSIEIPLSQNVVLQLQDFLENAGDNYTPTPALKYSIRKTGQGAGFPVDSIGNPLTTVAFNCSDLGVQTVELWAKDLNGNAGFCTATVTVADADSSCAHTYTVGGALKTETDDAVANANVAISVTHPLVPPYSFNTQSNAQGGFSFAQSISPGSSYTLTPSKDVNPLNGVSTFDLLLTTRHILGITYLNSPYKIIAADVSHNDLVSTFDVVETRKLILGIYSKFPDNTSWRFVDKDFVFPNPSDPFQTALPESIIRSNVMADQLADDFVGIKVGDVNNSTNGDSLLAADDREREMLFFDIKNRDVRAGETFTAQLKAAEKVSAYQFTLNTDGLEVLDVLPGDGMGDGNFGIFPHLPGQSWEDAVTTSVENGAGAFAITFRSSRSGQLSEMLRVSSQITRAEAYKLTTGDDDAMTLLNIALRFDDGIVSKTGFELYQNQPNPFWDKTSIGFHLPENADATLTVFDETGRVLHTQSGHYPRGYNAVPIEPQLLGDAGVLYYKLQTATDSAVRKMVRVK